MLYQPEFDECKQKLSCALFNSGIPKTLWPYYIRLMAEQVACQQADDFVAKQFQQAQSGEG